MSLNSSPPPALPTELKKAILRCCDPSTLAVTSRVSLAFLELSVPILHDDIHLDELMHLEKLFCSRSGRPPSALDAVLSLDHVRSFTLANTDHQKGDPIISLDRFVNGSSLSISHLTLGVCRPLRNRDPSDRRWEPILPLFDPESVLLVVHPEVRSPFPRHAITGLETPAWPRLKTLELRDCRAEYVLGDAILFDQMDPSSGTSQFLTIVYDLRRGADELHEVLDPIGIGFALALLDPKTRVTKVNIRVDSDEHRELCLEVLKDEALWFEEFDQVERQRRVARVKFEVSGGSQRGSAE